MLIGCEKSGVIRREFQKVGAEAYSCDLVPAEDGEKKYHLQGDIFNFLDDGFDLLIAHPECRYLAVSGMHWTTRGLRDAKLTTDAIDFAERLWTCGIERICIENPVSVLSTRSILGKPSQIIQPWQFGHDASKKTCLWLKNLPPLQPTNIIRKKIYSNQTKSGQNRLGPSPERSALRAKSYEGIARCMAQSWGVRCPDTPLQTIN